jgi:hypothetical protein
MSSATTIATLDSLHASVFSCHASRIVPPCFVEDWRLPPFFLLPSIVGPATWIAGDCDTRDKFRTEAYHDIEKTGYGDYALNAHFRFIRQMLGRAERFCFYAEKEPGMFLALAAAFRDEILDD